MSQTVLDWTAFSSPVFVTRVPTSLTTGLFRVCCGRTCLINRGGSIFNHWCGNWYCRNGHHRRGFYRLISSQPVKSYGIDNPKRQKSQLWILFNWSQVGLPVGKLWQLVSIAMQFTCSMSNSVRIPLQGHLPTSHNRVGQKQKLKHNGLYKWKLHRGCLFEVL